MNIPVLSQYAGSAITDVPLALSQPNILAQEPTASVAPQPPGSLSYYIGSLDFPAATMLCVLFITVCIFVTTIVGKRRSRTELSNEFELAKIKLANERAMAERAQADKHERAMAEALNNYRLEEQKIGAGLITSHSETREG